MWKQHNQQLEKLNQLYHRTSKQTQNHIQMILNNFEFQYSDLYSIANKKTKQQINILIEEWLEEGLLSNKLSRVHNEINNINDNSITSFGMLAINIYNRTKVKNSEILELLIYSAYVKEQNKIENKQDKIFKEDVNYYYEEGQKEVNKNRVSVITDALFLSILEQATINGWTYEQWREATLKYNADIIYKQIIIDIQQQKRPKIDSDVYQNIIRKQNNSRLCINGDKYSGSIETLLIGMNNQAKLEGIIKNNNAAKVKFIAVEDNVTTKMCRSLDGQIFNAKDINEFKRYSEDNKNIVKYKCKGLVMGLNLPPIVDHFHFCRSTITYQMTIENNPQKEYNAEYIRKNKYTTNKNIDSEIKKAINILPISIQELIKNTQYKISKSNSYYDRKKDTIYLLKDSDKYEIIHEIGHVVETKLDLLHNSEYIKIQENEVLDINLMTDINKISGYEGYDFITNTGKFISEYQRKVYETDIDDNYFINFDNYSFNTKTLGEYFSEGFRCYFERNELLKKKDTMLYNFIKELL